MKYGQLRPGDMFVYETSGPGRQLRSVLVIGNHDDDHHEVLMVRSPGCVCSVIRWILSFDRLITSDVKVIHLTKGHERMGQS